MAIVYKTEVISMRHYVEDGFVFDINYKMSAIQDEILTVDITRNIRFVREPGQILVDFDKLKEEDVVAWLDPKDVIEMKNILNKKIETLNNPPVVQEVKDGMPWVQPLPPLIPPWPWPGAQRKPWFIP